MPGQLKEVRSRIKSVSSTQQITKAMKVVSAAKLRKAQDRIIQMRPYSNKLNEMLSNIAGGSEGAGSVSFAREREVKNVLMIVVTSDRGLCGGFNSNILKLAAKTMNENYGSHVQAGKLTILPIGKKALEFFRRRNIPVIADYSTLFLDLNFEATSKAAQFVMDGFENKTFDKVDIVYSQFKNAATQIFNIEAFLPVAKPSASKTQTKKLDLIFEPSKDEMMIHLVPKILKTQLFKVLLDSNASEHGARMTAMDKASDNANEILRELKIKYNRARQAAITTELTEIVSGAAALNAE